MGESGKTEGTMLDLDRILEDVRRGMVPAHHLQRRGALRPREASGVFGRSWMFLAHESEIPQPGDYVVRRIVDDSFIVSRDEPGAVRALFNMCLHRGMQVCRAEVGNASHFRCPYHALDVPQRRRASWACRSTARPTGRGRLRRRAPTLLPAPGSTSTRADLRQPRPAARPPRATPSATSGSTSTSTSARASTGVELRGPQRWRVKANWKIGAENFCRRQLPHAPHPRQRGRHRPVPRAKAPSARRARSTSPAAAGARPTSSRPATSTRTWPTSATPRDGRRACGDRGRRRSGAWSATTVHGRRRPRCSRTSASCTTGPRCTPSETWCRSSPCVCGSR